MSSSGAGAATRAAEVAPTSRPQRVSAQVNGASSDHRSDDQASSGPATEPSTHRWAWRVGSRPLIAKSCPDCGEFLPADQFCRNGGGKREVYCRKCKYDRRDMPARWRRMLANHQLIQDFTRTHAHRHRELWIDSDHAVLSDPSLTLAEKALRLQRTYVAVVNQVVRHQYKSKPVDLIAAEVNRLASSVAVRSCPECRGGAA